MNATWENQRDVYLLHFVCKVCAGTRRFGHAGHYFGSSYNAQYRLRLHNAGRSGVKLLRAARKAGIRFVIARIWEGDRWTESVMKGRQRRVTGGVERAAVRTGSPTSWAPRCPQCRSGHPACVC